MLEMLRRNPSARLVAGIAAGVFVGLAAYRIVHWLIIFVLESWQDSNQDSHEAIVVSAVYLTFMGGMFFFWKYVFTQRSSGQEHLTSSRLFRRDATGPVVEFYMRHRTNVKSAGMTLAVAIGLPFCFVWLSIIAQTISGKH